MRVTQSMLSQNSLAGINRNMQAIANLQNQLSTGKSINLPSDSPTGTNNAMQVRGALAANSQYDKNMTDGKTWLTTTDSTLEGMVTDVQKIRDLTVQAGNDSLSDTDRQAISTQIGQLRSDLLSMANTQVAGRPIFGGPTSSTVAYAADGTYMGRGGTAAQPAIPNNRRISDHDSVRVDITGAEAFGDQSQGADLFAVVGTIASDVTGNPSALDGDLNSLDTAMSRLSGALADIGARTNRLTSAQTYNTGQNLTMTTQLASIEDVDMPRTITNLQLQQTSYQAALSVASQALQTSLVDFLR